MPDIEHQKLAIEIISTLVYMKRPMVDLILRPAGIPADIYQAGRIGVASERACCPKGV